MLMFDTNVLVYRHDASNPTKQVRADDWLRVLVHERSGRLSFQVGSTPSSGSSSRWANAGGRASC